MTETHRNKTNEFKKLAPESSLTPKKQHLFKLILYKPTSYCFCLVYVPFLKCFFSIIIYIFNDKPPVVGVQTFSNQITSPPSLKNMVL